MISYNDITLFIMHRQLYEHPQIPHLGGDEITKERETAGSGAECASYLLTDALQHVPRYTCRKSGQHSQQSLRSSTWMSLLLTGGRVDVPKLP